MRAGEKGPYLLQEGGLLHHLGRLVNAHSDGGGVVAGGVGVVSLIGRAHGRLEGPLVVTGLVEALD